ncbi:unnamed protein product, partial [Ectocarpus fasciculatus]
ALRATTLPRLHACTARGAGNTGSIARNLCSTMLARIKEYFEDRGVTASNLPKVIVVHECLSVAFLALTWAVCYQIQPTQARHPRGRERRTERDRQTDRRDNREACCPVFAPINRTIQNSNNAFIVRSRQSFEALISKSEKRLSQEWLNKRGIDSGRVAISLAESTLFRKLAKPVTIPGKLWLTLKLSQTFLVNGDHDNGTESTKRRREQKPLGKEASSGTGGWGWRRKGRGSGKRRKAICPPGSRGGGKAPGCFVAVPQAPSRPLLRSSKEVFW